MKQCLVAFPQRLFVASLVKTNKRCYQIESALNNVRKKHAKSKPFTLPDSLLAHIPFEHEVYNEYILKLTQGILFKMGFKENARNYIIVSSY